MRIIYIIFLTVLFSNCSIFEAKQTGNIKAKELVKREEYDKAITKLEEHIRERTKVKNKPKWENPYIYYLDIGDIYLKKNEPEKALKYFLVADSKKVDKAYINHRLRSIANYYVSKNQYEKAIKHLNSFKHRDELLFGLMLDRIAREIVEKEDH